MIRPSIAACTLFLLAVLPPASAQEAPQPIPIEGEWVTRWRSDLEFARSKMPETHLRIDHSTPLTVIETAIDELTDRIPQLTHQAAVVELTRIVAMIGDGHTRLSLPIDPVSGFSSGHTGTQNATLPSTPFHHYPVRFHLYADGLAIEQTTPSNTSLLGARVVRIGSMSTEEAIAAVEPLIHRDNETQMRELLPRFLVIPEILHVTGVTNELGSVALELELASGTRRELTLDPVPTGVDVPLTTYPEPSTPLFRRHLDANYRFESLEEHGAVHFRYFRVQNEEGGEPLADFATRMFDFVEENDVERLIVDLRGNDGGNNWLNAPLERGVFRAESLWRPGGLVVIADRGTFSAAMNFASFMANATPAVFVGEATGGRPNHYGDAQKLVLPKTGLTVRLSTVYHQDSGASDARTQIDPHLPIPTTSSDARSGYDPVLGEIASWSEPGDPAGSWRGPLTVRRYVSTVSVELTRTDVGWSGTFEAAGLVLPTPIGSVTQVDGELRFEVPVETTTLRVRTIATQDRLIGMLDYQGQWYPFAASRQP
jgi:hypothetical protein